MLKTIHSATRLATSPRNRAITLSIAAILFLCLFSRILQILPFSTPSSTIVALEILSARAFALIHGAQHCRVRGILSFAAICLVIGNITEHIGVETGFPYGHYEFLPLMGPQFLRVPSSSGSPTSAWPTSHGPSPASSSAQPLPNPKAPSSSL